MHTAERVRYILFVTAVIAVYVLAAGAIVQYGLAKLGLGRLSARPIVVWPRRAVLALAAAGAACFAYGYYVEPYWPEVTHVRLTSAKLAPGSRPIRIVHVSDIHSEARPRLEERLPDLIAGARPDLVVVTGDCLNSASGLPVFRRCLTRVAEIAPTYVVRGNWDVWFWSDLDLFGGTGARELDGEAVTVDVGGTTLCIAGAPVERARRISRGEDPHEAVAAALTQVPPGVFTVLLHHYSDEVFYAAERGVDLYCAGHTHGGQVALPFYGAVITLSKFGKRFERGLYRVGDLWLYVNRGIGMEGGNTPRVRFCARPEVTVIEVAPAA
jgi:predicted MPP superfamily phosphohydrolase